MDTIRTFTAVDLDDETKSDIFRLTKKFHDIQGKITFTNPENIHITLNFLGDVPSAETPKVCKIVKQLAAEFPPFQFKVNGFRPVERRGRIDMIWADIQDSSGTLAALQDQLNNQFAVEGFRAENRKFNPHLTIARVRSTPDAELIREKIRLFASDDISTVNAQEITVYTSQLTPQGPIYTPLTHCPFCG